MDFSASACPDCQSQNLKIHTVYETRNHGRRRMYRCVDCGRFFSETSNSFLVGIRKPITVIVQVLEARTEGVGLNATSRIFKLARNTIVDWERRLGGVKRTLTLYALLKRYLQLVVEGDEVYTKVGKNAPPDESLGWTVVLMDRSSRFLWELRCGRKDRKLFKKALGTLERLVNQTRDISLITDGERRYGNVLFEICHDLIKNGKRGRPRKTLKKGVKVRVKNKGSQAQKRGPKRPKYQAPISEHPETAGNIQNEDIHANHCEAFNSSLRRKNSTFRRKSNTYAKNENALQRALDLYWVVHNFMRPHFTTKQVPAVSIGILGKAFSWEDLFMIPTGA